MLKEQCRVGMKVFFGRGNGEKTLAEIEKINDKTAAVKTLEERGHGRGGQVGACWRVGFSLLEAAEQADVLPPVKLEYDMFDTVSEYILLAINTVYGALSPENLSQDGELPASRVREKQAVLNRQLKGLCAAFGRPVKEEEVWDWYQSREKSLNKRKLPGSP